MIYKSIRPPRIGLQALFHLVVWTCWPGIAVADVAYTVTDLGVLGGAASAGFGINASGQVTGKSTTGAFLEEFGLVVETSFLWTPTTPNGTTGTMVDIGGLGGYGGSGTGINAFGQITGYSQTTVGDTHPFLWTPALAHGSAGTMVDIGTIAARTFDENYGMDINDSGQIAVRSPITVDHAAMYDGAFHDLGVLSGEHSEAVGINAIGQVVGNSFNGGALRFPFLWTPSTANGSSGLMKQIIPQLGGATAIQFARTDYRVYEGDFWFESRLFMDPRYTKRNDRHRN